MTELVIRHLAEGEEHIFEAHPESPMSPSRFGLDYRTLAARHEYRPEWSWVALRGDTVVARAAWWAGPDDVEPAVLDWFDFTDPAAAVDLLRTAGITVDEYSIRLAPDWEHDPVTSAAVRARVDAVAEVGMHPLVLRHRYEWTPACGLPPRPNRLEYRPEPDDEVFLAALREMSRGSLDAHAQRAMAAADPDADPLTVAAKEDLEILRWFPSPREWWRLAYTPAGELAGLTVPARNYGGPVIGLIGVVADQRGHGYGYDLLVETTWMLVREGAERIVAATDVTNKPMAAAFAKAGYPIVQQRYDLTRQASTEP